MNWIAFVLILSGNLMIGNKSKSGFIMIAIGSILWMTIGFRIKDYALVLTNISGIIIMIRNWVKWRNSEKNLADAP